MTRDEAEARSAQLDAETAQPSKPESTEGTPGHLPGGVQPWAAGG